MFQADFSGYQTQYQVFISAIQHLDKIRWHDKQIRVATSKHSNVQMPKEGQPDAGLTRDYSQSSLHRFKKPGSKNYLNIYPPSSTLHLSNIPPNITEEFLTSAFEQRGYVPKGFKFFPFVLLHFDFFLESFKLFFFSIIPIYILYINKL
ncbi:unnamed protein product [Onchocerca flexuosa]|uniref:RRM domain-containing protein n=1 Tax=Onchocerca flexuosa TaxID=387005 RepID=A0A183HVH2_9BILA|nr:unnamed protein product [Onchocerca flexuosa]